jgi:anti-sigma B factor antagonist
MTYRVEERVPGALVVSIEGRITVENGDGAFVQAIESVLASRPRRVTVDLQQVTSIDSIGLGELVAGYVRAKHAGCRLGVVRANRRVLEILRVTRVATFLLEQAPALEEPALA